MFGGGCTPRRKQG